MPRHTWNDWGTTAPPPPGSVGGGVGGLSVTTESASQIAAVYGCCALLADSVASLPLRALDAPAHLVTSKETKTLPPLLEKPFELISLTDWLVGLIWALALRGNYFGRIIERDRLGFPTQIMPVNPDIVRPQIERDGSVKWFFAGKRVPTEDVFHVRYQSMPGQLLGLNPIQCMKYSFGLAHATDVWAANYYQNSGNPQGVIEVPGQLNPTSTKQMAGDWIAAHQGINKSNLPAVLTEGAKFNPLNINPADQQLLEARKYSAEEISGIVFRIPPHMVGLNERSTSFGRGIEQQERGFVANTLSGYLVRAERALTSCLPPGTFANFDISRRIRGSELERAQTASLMMLAGMANADMLLGKFFDMPPLPNGEGKFVNSPINTELLQKQLLEIAQMKKAEEPTPESEDVPTNGKGNAANVPVPK